MALKNDTVQKTLCMPLWARAIAARKAPGLLPDHDAERILAELGAERPTSFYRLQYVYLNVAIRHWNMAQEITSYVQAHPRAAIVELGCGLSCQRRQMQNAMMDGSHNTWYEVDFPNVIELRQRLIDGEGHERLIATDLNDFSWLDRLEAHPRDGVFFTGAGLFYYFTYGQVKALLTELAQRFPGGAIAFDAANERGARGVNKEIKLSGIDVTVNSKNFSLENAKAEIKAWSPRLVNVVEKDFFHGYLDKSTYRRNLVTRAAQLVMSKGHLGFFVHVDFAAS